MHRHICASNRLLNVHFEAVIGGLSVAIIMHERNVEEGTIEWSTWSADSGSHSRSYHRYEDVYVNAPFCGKLGFIAPEYHITDKCTLKNDVYAYGKMLLELILGQPIYDFRELLSREAFRLEDGLRILMNEGQLGRVIDSNLQGNYVEGAAERLVQFALLCTYEDPSLRPEMSEEV
ncbi:BRASSINOSTEROID INSENSITIVE 1-associated receptor kinase 1-like [Rhodamnia argentea]|uniref:BRASSINOSTEROID INSENSITIVE 1-associated receptor kinase 1-like n=1 Tax=Rhodamnia argentea TaxID=178133 RepID=A0ABM3HPM9_9MYRT|nr:BRASSINOSTEROID INSENSITIVE 1-associated receptor kinase 1-like [Rhodamnia argentea]